MIKRFALDIPMMSILSVSLIGALAGCQRQAPDDAPAPVAATTAAAPASATTQAPAAYQPPTAEQLFALVAPIALFPDRLVAQTLAASTHPDDVGAARDFLQQNRNLTGSGLIDAADGQPWDPSVKSLVAFPAVLDQLANNTEWTAALGAAYASEPTDVMNAIQVMRGRARAHGNLQNSAQQVVQVDARGPSDDETVAEDGGIVAAPAQTILIEPAESDVVYVPDYDPDAVYGEPIVTRVYSQGWYEAPPRRDDLVVTGLVSFGVGVLVGQLFSSHEHREPPRWGWNSWNTSWGGGRPGGPHYGRPAIVYDNHPYPVNRTTVINRTVNIDRSTHIDNRHDFNNNHVDNRRQAAPIAAAPRPAAPDYAHMQRPNFTAGMTRPTAPNARPALPPPQALRPEAQRGEGQRGDGRAPDFAQRPGQTGGQQLRPGQAQPGQPAARNEPTRFDPRQQVAGQVPHVDPREQQRAAQPGHQDARQQQVAQPQRVDQREQEAEHSRAQAQQRAAEAQRPQAVPQPQRPQQFERPPTQERPAPQRVEPQHAEPQREQQRAAPPRPEPQHENRAPAPKQAAPQPKQAAPQRRDRKDDHGG
ncbi:DUF3300 domain-containing protein [Luteibacter sp. OK325]|uniref:DUF3300 domain-containing protein n=1 Tax=Luteibacter sp. OK325 TaxID=2135670 RepID=UPI001304A684|nr:DUF3300 domain-containing protein [Luteibacter sp. OK325]